MRLYLGPVIAWLTLISIAELSADPVRSVRVVLPPRAGSVAQRAGQIFSRQINEWCDARVVTSGDATLSVELAVEPGIGTEGYRIADGPNGSVRIIGNDDRGLLYGVGKFLRASRYDRSGFTAGTWRGTSVPVLPMRGIYLSTHFNNFYEAAHHREGAALHRRPGSVGNKFRDSPFSLLAVSRIRRSCGTAGHQASERHPANGQGGGNARWFGRNGERRLCVCAEGVAGSADEWSDQFWRQSLP